MVKVGEPLPDNLDNEPEQNETDSLGLTTPTGKKPLNKPKTKKTTLRLSSNLTRINGKFFQNVMMKPITWAKKS